VRYYLELPMSGDGRGGSSKRRRANPFDAQWAAEQARLQRRNDPSKFQPGHKLKIVFDHLKETHFRKRGDFQTLKEIAEATQLDLSTDPDRELVLHNLEPPPQAGTDSSPPRVQRLLGDRYKKIKVKGKLSNLFSYRLRYRPEFEQVDNINKLLECINKFPAGISKARLIDNYAKAEADLKILEKGKLLLDDNTGEPRLDEQGKPLYEKKPHIFVVENEGGHLVFPLREMEKHTLAMSSQVIKLWTDVEVPKSDFEIDEYLTSKGDDAASTVTAAPVQRRPAKRHRKASKTRSQWARRRAVNQHLLGSKLNPDLA
jgi:hypothetical protein